MFYENPLILIGLAAAAILAGAWIIWVYSRRVTPEERERRRRQRVNRHPRTCAGIVTETEPDILHYRYELRGVDYFASQDVRALRAYLPVDPDHWIGPANVKYEPNNPFNSIVLCEEWSGLTRREVPAPKE